MVYNVIYNGQDEIIGYSNDIASDIRESDWLEDGDEMLQQLVDELDKIDYELVRVIYDPMGAYTCYKLEQGKELFSV